MRTAITVGKTHKGEWQLISTPDDNFVEQRKAFRALRVEKSHKDLSFVIYQENDGAAESIRLATPAEKKKADAQRTAVLESTKALGKEKRGESAEPEKAPEPKP